MILSALLIVCFFSQCTYESKTSSSSTNSEFTSIMMSESNTSSDSENPENIVVPQSSVDVMEESSSATETVTVTVTSSATVNENSNTSQEVSSLQSAPQSISSTFDEGNIIYADMKEIS